MKKLAMLSVALLAVTACQPASDANIDDLRADVEKMKLDMYGKVIGTCEGSDIYTDTSAYKASLEGLPEATIEGADWHKANSERDGVITTPTGLQYIVVREGKGDAKPDPTDIIKVNYHGFFKDGEKFDSSYDRGEPIEFPANGVIKGWIEAMGDMKPCEARTLFIPGDLAYGPNGRGSIPPNATLLFNVQLLGIEKKGMMKK